MYSELTERQLATNATGWCWTHGRTQAFSLRHIQRCPESRLQAEDKDKDGRSEKLTANFHHAPSDECMETCMYCLVALTCPVHFISNFLLACK
jgi:hypothetical protein